MAGNLKEWYTPTLVSFTDETTIIATSRECMGWEFIAVSGTVGSRSWTANLLTFLPLVTVQPLIVSQFFWFNGSSLSGSTDIGIYTLDGTTKLTSSGATVNAGTSTLQTVDITNYVLAPGYYWLALGSGNATTYQSTALAAAGLGFIGAKQQAAGWSSALPASITFAEPSVAVTPLYGFTGSSVI